MAIHGAAGFDRWGGPSPVVLSVPHAGRDYPAEMAPLLRLPPAVLATLEDRLVDRVALAARGRRACLVQRLPRAWIDLNRAEDERDPAVDMGAAPGAPRSPKVRSGLGLVPRRAAGGGELWRRRLTEAEVAARIRGAHRPYHDALAAALAAARDRFGVAVLVDLHSMPPLGPAATAPRVVVGDRFGRAAAARFVARAEAAARGAGWRTAVNVPYAGGHVLDRHADPARGVHGVQVELDRGLYLDARLEGLGDGFDAAVAGVAAMLAGLEDEALSAGLPLAAE